MHLDIKSQLWAANKYGQNIFMHLYVGWVNLFMYTSWSFCTNLLVFDGAVIGQENTKSSLKRKKKYFGYSKSVHILLSFMLWNIWYEVSVIKKHHVKIVKTFVGDLGNEDLESQAFKTQDRRWKEKLKEINNFWSRHLLYSTVRVQK